MPQDTITVLGAGRAIETPRCEGAQAGALWISREALEQATGWALEEEGLCRGDRCTLVPAPDRASVIDGDRVCASDLWKRLGRPVLHDAAERTWMLGEGASDRNAALSTLEAPDFSLPDLEGRLHSLTEHRGKKVLLVTWASW